MDLSPHTTGAAGTSHSYTVQRLFTLEPAILCLHFPVGEFLLDGAGDEAGKACPGAE